MNLDLDITGAVTTPASNQVADKIFVLDTNVILHDSACISQFDEHDVVIPIAVLEELDQFKKGNESIHFHARQFVRTMDQLAGDALFTDGIELGPQGGRLSIKLDQGAHPDLQLSFPQQTADHRILNCAYRLHRARPDTQVVLVTKDVNLRMKAKSCGLNSQDYRTDQVSDNQASYTGFRQLEGVDTALVERLLSEPFTLPANLLALEQPIANEFYIVRNGKKSALARYNAETDELARIRKTEAYGIESRNAGQAFALAALLDDQLQLLTISGKAGTGKTLLSIAAALECRKRYLQIYVARPLIPLSNRDIGYLPGDVNAKIIPYMQPLYDNLSQVQNQFVDTDVKHRRISAMLEERKLKIEPLAYIRGRSLSRIYFIVDEAQNLTPHEVKTIITRAGDGTKIIFTGDIHQIDHPYLNSRTNGLSYLISKMKGQPLYAHIHLDKGERSALSEMASNLL